MLKRDLSYNLFARDHYPAKREPSGMGPPPSVTVLQAPPVDDKGRRGAISPIALPLPPKDMFTGRRGAISQ